MTLKCRLCNAEIIIPLNSPDHGVQQRQQHLLPHIWQMLRLIQGKEGDGSIMRFMHALAFTGVNTNGEVAGYRHDSIEAFKRIQVELFHDALLAPAVDPNLKGASAPGGVK